jgi:tRNA(Ile)-lysidine synthase
MSDLRPFEEKLAHAWPPDVWRDVTVLVAVSGGADSVALFRGLTAVRQPGPGRLIAAHFNHGLRGAESDADEAYVGNLADAFQVPFVVGHVQDEAAASSGSLSSEAGAREARYRFLRRAAQQVGARYVVTAHTADDQAETVLHRILRGTGVTGVAGIRRFRQFLPHVALVRPLLDFRRAEVTEYLRAIHQPFREDPTNADIRFTRNRIRHELLPQLARDYNDDVVTAITRLASLAGEVQTVVDDMVEELAERCVKHRPASAVVIDCEALRGSRRFIIRELLASAWRGQDWPLQAMGLQQWEELAELAVGTSGSNMQPSVKFFPGGVRAERRGGTLTLLRPNEFSLDPDAVYDATHTACRTPDTRQSGVARP